MTHFALVLSIFAGARQRRRQKPRVSIMLGVLAPDGREAVSLLLWGRA